VTALASLDAELLALYVGRTTLKGCTPVDATYEAGDAEPLTGLTTLEAALLELYVGRTMLDGTLPVDAIDAGLLDDAAELETPGRYVGSTIEDGMLPVEATEDAALLTGLALELALELATLEEALYVG